MIARAQKYELTYLETEFPEYTPGDVNFDGDINVIDLSHAIDMIYNVGYNATPPADVNGDGTVNMVDVAILAQMAMNQ
jgi:hypothetical protein